MMVFITNPVTVSLCPLPLARSVDSLSWPPTPLIPSLLSEALYGFAFCAGMLWLELLMGASLVNRSYCETPVLIWT